MTIETIRDVGDLTARAQKAASSLRALQPRFNKQLIPPFPVPLTLTTFEEWLVAAAEALRKPKIAQSKKLLKDAGGDPTSVPADILSETEVIKALLEQLARLPREMRAKAISAGCRALTNGIDDASTVVRAFVELAASLKPIQELMDTYPAVCSLLFQSVPETRDQHTEYVKIALRIRDLMDEAMRLGAEIPMELETVQALEDTLSKFDNAYRDLHALLSAENLSDQDLPSVKNLALCKATEVCREKYKAILEEKKSLRADYAALDKRLIRMAVASTATPESLAELREAVPALRKRLAERHKEIIGTLGEDVATLVDSVMNGELPSSDLLDDPRLGQALRKAASAGFTIRMEAPHEDQ